MFDRLTPDAPDGILQLMQMFRDDPRPDKLDLGIGVFRDAAGATPVMAAVQKAEARILAAQTTKTYTWFAGAPEFGQAIARLVLGDARDADRLAVAATPGGTGALRMAFDLVRGAAPDAAVWLPAQGWPNHAAMLHHTGMPVRTYAHAAADGTLAFDRMMGDLAQARAGDVVLVHGCCHNPTGIDPDAAQWHLIGDLCTARGLLPLVDLAYQGFGDGIDADAAGVRQLARICPELLVAVSASKTFGVYRDRVGALLGLAQGPAAARRLQGRCVALNRLSISFPPDHGARVVQTVLDDPALRALWATELDAMRIRIARLRMSLTAALAGLADHADARPAPADAGARPAPADAGDGPAPADVGARHALANGGDGPSPVYRGDGPSPVNGGSGLSTVFTGDRPAPADADDPVRTSAPMDPVGPRGARGQRGPRGATAPLPPIDARGTVQTATAGSDAPLRPVTAPDLPATLRDPRFAAIAQQRGMFSCLPLDPDRMDRLRRDHAVYATRDGRISIAGLTEATIPVLAARIAAVL